MLLPCYLDNMKFVININKSKGAINYKQILQMMINLICRSEFNNRANPVR